LSKGFSDGDVQQQLDLTGEPAGLYFLRVQLKNGQLAASKISIR